MDSLGNAWTSLSDLPRIMVSTAVTVVLMTALVMPVLTRALRGWLRPATSTA